MSEMSPTEAGRALAAHRAVHDRECSVCGRRFVTSGRGMYCGHACKKRAYRKRQSARLVVGTNDDLLFAELDAFRAAMVREGATIEDSGETIRQIREERDEEIWHAISS